MKLGLGSVVVSAVVVVVVGVVLAALLESHAAHPLFDDDLLHKIANEASKKYLTAQEVDKQVDNNVKQNLTLDDMFDEVTAKLMKAYPGHIFDGLASRPPPQTAALTRLNHSTQTQPGYSTALAGSRLGCEFFTPRSLVSSP